MYSKAKKKCFTGLLKHMMTSKTCVFSEIRITAFVSLALEKSHLSLRDGITWKWNSWSGEK